MYEGLGRVDPPGCPHGTKDPARLPTVYDVLLIAFGWGVWKSADRRRALRITAALLVTHGFIDLAAGPFAAMHRREVIAAGGGTSSDILHLVLAGEIVLSILLIMGFGAVASGKRFRVYSIASILVAILFGTLTGVAGPRVAADQPTPWVGLMERISAFVFMLWVVALAWVLLRARGAGSRPVISLSRYASSPARRSGCRGAPGHPAGTSRNGHLSR